MLTLILAAGSAIDSVVKNPAPVDKLTDSAQTAAPQRSGKILWLSAVYACFFLITLWAAYHNQLPLNFLEKLPNYDKFGHVILYCIASYLGHYLCRQKHFKPAGLSLPVFPVLFALFTITEELLQGLSPYRTLDAGDLLCSFSGIGLGYWFAQRAGRHTGTNRR